MSTPKQRIESLVNAGTIAQEEGARLIAALGDPAATARATTPSWLNPFERFGGEMAAGVGLMVALASVAITRLGVRFDGFLDLHTGTAVCSYKIALFEQGVAWLLPALAFWAFASLLTRRGRLIDFVGAFGLSRLPLVLVAAPVAWLTPGRVSPSAIPTLTPALALIVLLSLVCIGWQITWLYQGYKNAAGLKGPKSVVSFIGLVVVCEILSKVLLSVLA